jgi:hypothetical protein
MIARAIALGFPLTMEPISLSITASSRLAEMCYKAVGMVFTHYNPHEHYLEILREQAVKLDTLNPSTCWSPQAALDTPVPAMMTAFPRAMDPCRL